MNAPQFGGLGALVRQRGYLTALVSNTVSRFGDSVDSIAFGWMVYQLTGSTLLMGTVFAVNGLPGLLFGLFAGALVDRLPKKPVVVLCHLVRAAGVGTLAALHAGGILETWMVLALTFLNSTAEAFTHPANAGLSQRIVPKDSYLEATSLTQSASSIAELAGLGCAGWVLATVGTSGALALDAFTFLFAAVGISSNPLPPVEAPVPEASPGTAADRVRPEGRGILEDIRTGLGFLRRDRLVRLTLVLAVFANFAIVPFQTLQPAYVKDVLGVGPEGMSAIGIGITLGMAAGGLGLAKYGKGIHRLRLILTGFLGAGTLYASFALPGILPAGFERLAFAAAASFPLGAFIALINATAGAYLMERTPPELMGRTIATVNVAATSAMPLGAALSGLAAEAVLPTTIFGILGAAMAAVTFLTLFRSSVRAEPAGPPGVPEAA